MTLLGLCLRPTTSFVMDIRQLQYLAALAREKHFTREGCQRPSCSGTATRHQGNDRER